MREIALGVVLCCRGRGELGVCCFKLGGREIANEAI